METASLKIKPLDTIIRLRARFRELKKRLVFTNGCFDILHVGHVRYLNQARQLGDILVVGVNSDSSVRRIKGSLRPVTPENERAEIVAALSSVDYVFLFDDLTPQRVIDRIVPDVLVKGSDWHISRVVGRSTVERSGGSVRTIPVVEGASTTDIIQKVLDRFAPHSSKTSIF